MFAERWAYLLVAELFAPVAECLLFWLASFGVGEVIQLTRPGWFVLEPGTQ